MIFFSQHIAPLFLDLARWVEGLGYWGPAVYLVIYAVATVAFVPGSILTLAAGAIFGLVKGGITVFIGATLGSWAAFLISRYLARGAVERRIKGSPKFAAIDRAIEARGFFIVLLLRLSPVFPFNALNYGLGLTRVRFRDYAAASIGMLPGTVLYTYYGVAAGTLATLASEEKVQKGPGSYILLGVGLVATIVVTVVITRAARRALKEATDGG